MSLLFESELKSKMTEYGDIKNQVDTLKLQMAKMREQIDEWMKLNKLTHHQIIDTIDRLWQLDYTTRTSKKPNWSLIRELIPEDRTNDIVIESVSDPYLSIRAVKNIKKKKSKTTPEIPTENI